jgi:D-alanyl-D-alanine carboxypeptidase/D-alanyl-D-alanine-endopeptidase (penicillin-binding protein 4)
MSGKDKTHCLRVLSLLICLLCSGFALAQIPAKVDLALRQAALPRDALSVVVIPLGAGAAKPVRLLHQADVQRNPASLMKLVTTSAALDILGPAYTWRTPLAIDGVVRDGVLQGNVYIRGQGDPKIGVEQIWLILRRLQGLGIQKIQGDIVLDRSAFDVPHQDPGGFDGEPLRPYNASPDALLLGYKSFLLHFVPDAANKVARVHAEPPLAGVQVQKTVALSGADCSDYRASLKADFQNPLRISFAGTYPLACADKVWPVAYADPPQFAARAIHGMWLQLGGQLSGGVRDGNMPASLKPLWMHESPSLAEVARDINKFSNNVMADQLFLTLGLQQRGLGNAANSKAVIEAWWRERLGQEPPLLDKGSGLSREARISPRAMADLLQWVWLQPFMPELMASLPLTGVDGTMKRSKSSASAHLKTGSLRDVMGIAGYVEGPLGQRYVLVAIVNHANAHQARPVLDALIDWTAGK